MPVLTGARQQVVKLRQENLCATLQDIATHTKISRERVRQILKEEGLSTTNYNYKPTSHCLNCGQEIPSPISQPRIFCSQACFSRYHTILVECSQCGKLFTIRQSALLARTKRNKTSMIFCSNKCHGTVVGQNYGFLAHPENIGSHNHRKWSYQLVWRLRMMGLKCGQIKFLLDIPESTIYSILYKGGFTSHYKRGKPTPV